MKYFLILKKRIEFFHKQEKWIELNSCKSFDSKRGVKEMGSLESTKAIKAKTGPNQDFYMRKYKWNKQERVRRLVRPRSSLSRNTEAEITQHEKVNVNKSIDIA